MSELEKAILEAAQGPPSQGDDGWTIRHFIFPATFPGFAGHFPGNPVLPGFVQIMTAALLVCAVDEACGPCRCVRNAKFMAPVLPGQRLTVAVRLQDVARVEARTALEDRVAATFSLEFYAPI